MSFEIENDWNAIRPGCNERNLFARKRLSLFSTLMLTNLFSRLKQTLSATGTDCAPVKIIQPKNFPE